MATDAEQRSEERASISERIMTMGPDELGEATIPVGERLIIAHQLESVRGEIREANRLSNERMSRMEIRLGDMIAANAKAIAANAEAIAANAEGIADNRRSIAAIAEGVADNRRAIAANAEAIGGLSEQLTQVRVGIKEDVIAAYKEERSFSHIRKGWWISLAVGIVSSFVAVGLTILASRLGWLPF